MLDQIKGLDNGARADRERQIDSLSSTGVAWEGEYQGLQLRPDIYTPA
jgi:hypothetical protein